MVGTETQLPQTLSRTVVCRCKRTIRQSRQSTRQVRTWYTRHRMRDHCKAVRLSLETQRRYLIGQLHNVAVHPILHRERRDRSRMRFTQPLEQAFFHTALRSHQHDIGFHTQTCTRTVHIPHERVCSEREAEAGSDRPPAQTCSPVAADQQRPVLMVKHHSHQ